MLTIIPVLLSPNIEKQLLQDEELSSLTLMSPIDVSTYSFREAICKSGDEILKRVFIPGDIITYAKNFDAGVGGVEDKVEAGRLYKIYYTMALDQSGVSPNAYYALGMCYEFGWGTNVDFRRAAEIYYEVRYIDGLLIDEDLKRIYAKLDSNGICINHDNK